MNNATQHTVDIPPFLKEFPEVSTSGASSNQDDTTAVVTGPATREPSNSHYTLAEMLESPDATSPWNGDRVVYKYRNIIRDVIEELPEFVKSHSGHCLTPNDICIVNDRAKINVSIPNPSNTENLPTYRSQIRSLVTRILGTDNSTRVELKHFYHKVDKTGVALDDLWHHPLLMSSNERFYFPIDAILELQSKKGDAWRYEYNNGKTINIKAAIEKSNCDDFKSFHANSIKNTIYEDNALGVLNYSRNISIHIWEEQNTLVCTSQ
ncbi:hypothetical protein GBA52_008306 [Prunus armeniaca]|nr:hypothetical protein GBA52_008306 [Prunus armeniaca]